VLLTVVYICFALVIKLKCINNRCSLEFHFIQHKFTNVICSREFDSCVTWEWFSFLCVTWVSVSRSLLSPQMSHPISHPSVTPALTVVSCMWPCVSLRVLAPTSPSITPYLVCSFTVFYYIYSMTYTIEYWNPRDAEWRGTGQWDLPDLTVARSTMNSLSQQCHGSVRFRVTELTSVWFLPPYWVV